MPQIETWSRLPPAVRDHLVDRMRDRKISLDDLNQLRLWIESKPEVPEGAMVQRFRFIQALRTRRVSEDISFAGTSCRWRRDLTVSVTRRFPPYQPASA
jgi:hypothetical protein